MDTFNQSPRKIPHLTTLFTDSSTLVSPAAFSFDFDVWCTSVQKKNQKTNCCSTCTPIISNTSFSFSLSLAALLKSASVHRFHWSRFNEHFQWHQNILGITSFHLPRQRSSLLLSISFPGVIIRLRWSTKPTSRISRSFHATPFNRGNCLFFFSTQLGEIMTLMTFCCWELHEQFEIVVVFGVCHAVYLLKLQRWIFQCHKSRARDGCHLHFVDLYKERTHVLFKDFHPIWSSHVQ